MLQDRVVDDHYAANDDDDDDDDDYYYYAANDDDDDDDDDYDDACFMQLPTVAQRSLHDGTVRSHHLQGLPTDIDRSWAITA